MIYQIKTKIFLQTSSNNKVFCSGSNKYGRLGLGYKCDEYFKPQIIEFFNDKNIIVISRGDRHCLALSNEGLVYGWGDNSELNNSINQEI